MSYRKGELTPATVDREYPFQVALKERQHNWSCSTIERFCRIHALSVSPRGHAVVIGHHFYVVTCFATLEDADKFREAFDGYRFDPKDKGRGRNWMRWTPKTKPLTFMEEALIEDASMCNLYSHTSNRQAIIDLARAFKINESVGNLEPLPGIFPDYPAPIVRNMDGERELTMARWGMPSPQFALEGKKTDPGVTNIRNTKSPHWRRWLGVGNRCVVPFTSFSEFDHTKGPEGKKNGDTWFALDETRPLAFFAGLHVPAWTSTRKVKEGEVTADLFGFLTCPPNAEVGAIHPKAMPVVLTTADEIEHWLTAPWEDAQALQRPLPDGTLKVVAVGQKKDHAA